MQPIIYNPGDSSKAAHSYQESYNLHTPQTPPHGPLLYRKPPQKSWLSRKELLIGLSVNAVTVIALVGYFNFSSSQSINKARQYLAASNVVAAQKAADSIKGWVLLPHLRTQLAGVKQEIAAKKQQIAAAKASKQTKATAQTSPPPKEANQDHLVVPPVSKKKTAPAAVSKPCFSINSSASRSTSDMPDDNPGRYQIHIVYALPSDVPDRGYDTNGSIANSVSAWNNWLCNQTGGKTLFLDTRGGALDVTFVRFNSSDNTIKTGAELPWSTNPSNNAYVRDDIEIRLKALGLNDPKKVYAVYYDGTSNYSCGGGAFPPSLKGSVAARYLHGGPPGSPTACDGDKFPTNKTSTGYIEFGTLHEILHTLGFVASCAPHNTAASHVSDSNTDLMYAGSQGWYPSVLDINHDDYYATGNSSCLDLANSVFLVGGGNQLPPG